VLLDLKLPKIDGLEVLRRIKADPELKMVPVVMVTSSREERDLIDSYKLGVNAYVVKPVGFEQLPKPSRSLVSSGRSSTNRIRRSAPKRDEGAR